MIILNIFYFSVEEIPEPFIDDLIVPCEPTLTPLKPIVPVPEARPFSIVLEDFKQILVELEAQPKTDNSNSFTVGKFMTSSSEFSGSDFPEPGKNGNSEFLSKLQVKLAKLAKNLFSCLGISLNDNFLRFALSMDFFDKK